MEFNVGDKVVRSNGMSRKNIGTIIRVTEKRKDVVVDFGSYKLTYDMNGREKNCDAWSRSYIKPLTPEIEEKIRQYEIINKCMVVFDKNRNKITADEAKRILDILLDGES
jgi:hydroxymethylpyrimidine pyrophosphatase-like HAD family hydrolase